MNITDFPNPEVRRCSDGSWFATAPKWSPAPLGAFGATKNAAIAGFYEAAQNLVDILSSERVGE